MKKVRIVLKREKRLPFTARVFDLKFLMLYSAEQD